MGDNIDADSMLDVFTGVEVEENLVSELARELSDVSVHSLLEQTRQVAGDIRRRSFFPGR
jgi:ribosomal protein L12E/L44/L45/RPP1/RPP2